MGAAYDLILAAENGFARRVALGVIVKRPVKPLLQLVPGMFIFDFLRRTALIRKVARFYLPPRKAALNAARDIASGTDRREALDRARETLQPWLAAQGLGGIEAHGDLRALVEALVDHDLRLLETGGASHPEMIRSAYRTRKAYRAYLSELAGLERAFLGKAVAAIEDDAAGRQLEEEQDEAEAQRDREVDAVFL